MYSYLMTLLFVYNHGGRGCPTPTSLHLSPPHSTSLHLIPPHSTSVHLTPPHSTPFHLTPPHSTSLHLTPHHSTSLHLTPPHSTSHHLTPPHSTSLHLTPPHSTSLHLTPHHTGTSYWETAIPGLLVGEPGKRHPLRFAVLRMSSLLVCLRYPEHIYVAVCYFLVVYSMSSTLSHDTINSIQDTRPHTPGSYTLTGPSVVVKPTYFDIYR